MRVPQTHCTLLQPSSFINFLPQEGHSRSSLLVIASSIFFLAAKSLDLSISLQRSGMWLGSLHNLKRNFYQLPEMIPIRFPSSKPARLQPAVLVCAIKDLVLRIRNVRVVAGRAFLQPGNRSPVYFLACLCRSDLRKQCFTHCFSYCRISVFRGALLIEARELVFSVRVKNLQVPEKARAYILYWLRGGEPLTQFAGMPWWTGISARFLQ